jgi:hypothetical protein
VSAKPSCRDGRRYHGCRRCLIGDRLALSSNGWRTYNAGCVPMAVSAASMHRSQVARVALAMIAVWARVWVGRHVVPPVCNSRQTRSLSSAPSSTLPLGSRGSRCRIRLAFLSSPTTPMRRRICDGRRHVFGARLMSRWRDGR